MSIFKDCLEEDRITTDRILKNLADKIYSGKYPDEQLTALVNAYTELLYARMDLEEM